MNCLSVRQPWADLLFRPEYRKDVENRVWTTRKRGPLLIHASAGMTRQEYADCCAFCRQIGVPPPEYPQVRGKIIGLLTLVACVPDTQRRSIWHVRGQYGLYTSDPIAFPEPIPYTGRLGIFDVPEHVFLPQLDAALEAALHG